MTKHFTTMLAAGVLLAAASPAAAATYNLSNDFSNAANPNGAWSYTQGTTPLPHFAQPSDGNTLNRAAANGYWGSSANFTTTPIILKVTQNGAATAPYNDGDFLAGDVIVHSTNPGAGAPAFINWTAPGAGTLGFTSALWYAHSPVARSSNVSVSLNGTTLGTVTIANGVTRATASTSLSFSGLNVAAGDVLSFGFVPTAGQQFGSLIGISETIDFTPGAVPEPATWAMLVGGFGLAGGAMRRRKAAVRFV